MNTQAAAVFSTWAKRCDKVIFVTEEDDEDLPTMKVDVTGRETKISNVRAYSEYGAHLDWFFKVNKADHDTFIIMENLKQFLRDFNSSSALFVGSLYVCR